MVSAREHSHHTAIDISASSHPLLARIVVAHGNDSSAVRASPHAKPCDASHTSHRIKVTLRRTLSPRTQQLVC